MSSHAKLIEEIREMLARPPGAFHGSDQLRRAMRALRKLEPPAVRQDNHDQQTNHHDQQTNHQEKGDLDH